MRRLIEKASALIRQTELDFTVFDKSGKVIVGKDRPYFGEFQSLTEREDGLTYFKITYNSATYVACVSEDVGKASVKLLQQYFIDACDGEASIEREIGRYLGGKLDLKQKIDLDKRLSGKQFFPVLFVVSGADKRAELTDFLSVVKSDADYVTHDGDAIIFLKSVSGEYASCEELATVMYDAIKQERRIDVKVCSGGRATDLSSLDYVIKRAYLALKYRGSQADVCNYKQCADTVLYETMTADQRKIYLGFMLDGVKNVNVFKDDELLKTAKVLMDCSLSLTGASKKLFLHRNTLTHRLDKIYDDCGLDLRTFDGAKTFQTISEIYAIAVKNGEIK